MTGTTGGLTDAAGTAGQTADAAGSADLVLLGLARALRRAGLPVTADRERTFLTAAARIGLGRRGRLYWAARATLTCGPGDFETFDVVFAAWFGDDVGQSGGSEQPDRATVTQAAIGADDAAGADGRDEDTDPVAAAASDAEVLRHRDIAELSAAEKVSLARQFAQLSVRLPTRRTPRRVPARRGRIDGPATLRSQLRRIGEPGPILHHARASRPRTVVLLIDVSGSMGAYADSLLRLAHTVVQAGLHSRSRVEVFTIGSRLTRVTRALAEPDADRALIAAGEIVPDWSGGTRLGESVGAFLDRWGRRGMARGAVVVVFSDGWERAEPALLGAQMAAVSRLAHRVVWANPHRGRTGYQPVQSGIVAVLPHLDALVAGHSWASFRDLLGQIADNR